MARELRVDELTRGAVFWAHAARAQVDRLRSALNRLDPSGADSPTVEDWWQASAEHHYALLAIAHVIKACDRLPALPRQPEAELFVLLRHYAEHWEDPEGRSGKRLAEVRPEHADEPVFYWPDRFILHGVESTDLDQWLTEVESTARSLLVGSDEQLPDLSERIM